MIYIAPFYLSATLRTSSLNSRDSPAVIKARVRAVGLSCVVCTVITVYILAIKGHATPGDVLRMFGVWPISPLDIARVLALVALLFVGPLYESFVIDGDWRSWTISNIKEGLSANWVGYRNLVIAPASEELVFRALIIPLYLLAKVSTTRIVFLTPLIFGIAHAHHLVDFLRSRTPEGHRSPPLPVWINGLLRTVFEFTYTSLFGFFAAFVFLRTGSLYAAIMAHSFCNWMGVPRLYGRVGQYDVHVHMHVTDMTPDVAQGKKDDALGSTVRVGNAQMQEAADESEKATQMLQAGPQPLGIGWTILYYALIFGGAWGFYKQLWPLTTSHNALATF